MLNTSQPKNIKSHSYHVAESSIHGKGVFASRQINEGEILGVLSTTPAKRNGSHVLWNACYYDTLEVVALRDINEGEEITHDYSGE